MMSERLENNISPDDINDYEIPEGLNDLLHEFAVSVLIEKPNSLHDFAADYFTKLRDSKRTKTIPMYIVVDDDDDAGEPEEIRLVMYMEAGEIGVLYIAVKLNPTIQAGAVLNQLQHLYP